MAAKRGSATAQYNLGLYYKRGIRGLTQSSKRAIEYYTLAAEHGLVEAHYDLGGMYAQGEGIETSFSKAQENCGQKQQHKDTKMLLKILKYTWTMQDCKYE